MVKVNIKFSTRVLRRINRVKLEKDIINSIKESKDMKNEIRRVFQQANRRIQNIENKGDFSPAYESLGRTRAEYGYTKFSMRGSWDELLKEYATAVSFLQQPTSMATGVREYKESIKGTYGLTDDQYDFAAKLYLNKLGGLMQTDAVMKKLLNYKVYTGDFESTVSSLSNQIENDSEAVERAVTQEIEKAAQSIVNNSLNDMPFGLRFTIE